MPGACMWKKFLGWVSLHIGTPLGDLGRGGPSIGNFNNYLKEGSGFGASLSVGAPLGEPGGGRGLLCWGPRGL